MDNLKKIIILLIIGGALFMGLLFTLSQNHPGNYGIVHNKTLENIKAERIYIKCIPINIDVIAYSEDVIKVEIYGDTEQPDKINLSVTDMNNNLTITVNKKNHSIFSFKNNDKLIVYIPQKYENSLNIETSEGSTDISGFQLKSLEINATSGHINVSDSEVNTCHLGNSSGKIDISGFKGDLNAKNSSGGVTVEYEALLNNKIVLSSNAGSVKLKLPSNPDFFIKAKSLSGKIVCDYDLVADINEQREIEGVCNKALNTIDIKTGSGNIYIR